LVDPVGRSPISGSLPAGLFGDDGGDQRGLAHSLMPAHDVHQIEGLPTALPRQADEAKQPSAGQLLREQLSTGYLQHDQGLYDVVELVLVGVRPEGVQGTGREQSSDLQFMVGLARTRGRRLLLGAPRRLRFFLR
jgi:hypothetical protein